MNIEIPYLNRATDEKVPQMIQIAALGEWVLTRQNPTTKKPEQVFQVCDAEAFQNIATEFNEKKAADPGYRVLIDFEHHSYEQGGGMSSAASGWINKMEARPDGVYAEVEWTDAGEAAIKNRRYRFLSPVWYPHDCDHLGNNRYRPRRIDTVGMTNRNRMTTIQPLWNRGDEPHDPINHNIQNTMDIEKLNKELGLPEGTTEQGVFAAIRGLRKRTADLTEDNTAMKNRLDETTKTLADRTKVIAEQTLEPFKNTLTQESQGIWLNRLCEDFEGTKTLLEGIKPAGTTPAKTLHQQNGGQPPAESFAGEDPSPFKNRVDELVAKENLPRTDAMAKAVEENPGFYDDYQAALFGATEWKKHKTL